MRSDRSQVDATLVVLTLIDVKTEKTAINPGIEGAVHHLRGVASAKFTAAVGQVVEITVEYGHDPATVLAAVRKVVPENVAVIRAELADPKAEAKRLVDELRDMLDEVGG